MGATNSSPWYIKCYTENKNNLIVVAHGGRMSDNRHKWKKEGFRPDLRRVFCLKIGRGTGRLYSLHPWRFSGLNWAKP